MFEMSLNFLARCVFEVKSKFLLLLLPYVYMHVLRTRRADKQVEKGGKKSPPYSQQLSYEYNCAIKEFCLCTIL